MSSVVVPGPFARRLPNAPPEARVALTLFGAMRATDAAGRDVLPRQRKTRALLAVLALAAPRAVARSTLTDLLWSTRDREQARASLRQSVHELQDSLAPFGPGMLLADRANLAFADATIAADARDLARASVARPAALAVLEGGPFLRDLVGLDPAFDRWIAEEERRLRRGAAAVAAALLAACLAEGAGERTARAAAERLVAIDRTSEAGWRGLMTALAAAGDRAGAVDAYERCCTELAEHARLTPSAQTEALIAAIRGQSGTLHVLLPPVAPLAVTETMAPDYASGEPAPAALLAPACDAEPLPAQPLLPQHLLPQHLLSQPLLTQPLLSHPEALRQAGAKGVRLGVMPFRALGSTAPDVLGLGLAEEITGAMARFRWVYLIATGSLATVQAGPMHERDRRIDALGLDFMIDGTIQRADGRIRVTTQLLDMHAPSATGRPVVWAQRFDGTDTDLLTLQDRVASEMVARIDPELMLRAGARTSTLTTQDLGAYDLMLRAIPAIYRIERAGFAEAGGLLREAVARDPDYASAQAWLAYWLIFQAGQGWSDNVAADLRRAGELTERAITLDPSDARALTIAGHVRAFMEHRMADAHILHDRALALNPNLPLAWVLSGLALSYDGEHEEAVRRAEEAARLSPLDPHRSFFIACVMVPHLALRDFKRVVELARDAISLNPALSATYKGYLSALGHLGPSAERDAVRARLLELEPRFCVRAALDRSPLQRLEDRELYAEGLRRAGLRETRAGA